VSTEKLVTGVITFLNAEKFLKEAVESVLAQTYDNWELLLVDDGSTDGSTAIAQRYSEQLPGKVHYLEHAGHENRGAAASRNLGFGHARGEYVALLDSDDVWLPHKLEDQVAILDTHPEAGMVFGQSQYWHSWSSNPEDIQYDSVPKLGVQTDTLYDPPTLLTLLYPLGDAIAPCPSDLLLRRVAIERVGGFEESFRGVYQLYDDQTFLTKLYLNVPVFVAGKCWDRYRQHPEQCVVVAQKAGQYHTVRMTFLKWLAEYLYAQGLKDTEIWKLLQEKQLQASARLREQQIRDKNEQLGVSRTRIKELNSALTKQRRKMQRLKKQNQELTREVRELRGELQYVRNSKFHRRLSHAVARIKASVLG
jgi:glycosyltransferase involved in cell wall biosynthesis